MKTKNKQIQSGGFHITWLIPLEGFFAFLVLSISLKFGFVEAFLVVLTIFGFGYITKKFIENEPKAIYNIKSWSTKMKLFTKSNQKNTAIRTQHS